MRQKRYYDSKRITEDSNGITYDPMRVTSKRISIRKSFFVYQIQHSLNLTLHSHSANTLFAFHTLQLSDSIPLSITSTFFSTLFPNAYSSHPHRIRKESG